MKKLMIALGAVVLAAGVQAATLQWTMLKVAQQGTVTSGYSAYLLDASKYASFDAALSDLMSKGAGASGYLYSKTGISAASGAVKSTVNDTAWALPQKGVDKEGNPVYYQNGDDISLYAIFLDGTAGTGATAKNYLTATAAADTKNISSAGKLTVAYSDLSARTWAALPAPEPTSGLLMLLGMAGLALRRRRA